MSCHNAPLWRTVSYSMSHSDPPIWHVHSTTHACPIKIAKNRTFNALLNPLYIVNTHPPIGLVAPPLSPPPPPGVGWWHPPSSYLAHTVANGVPSPHFRMMIKRWHNSSAHQNYSHPVSPRHRLTASSPESANGKRNLKKRKRKTINRRIISKYYFCKYTVAWP